MYQSFVKEMQGFKAKITGNKKARSLPCSLMYGGDGETRTLTPRGAGT